MIALEFVSKVETRIVDLINQIIQNYQKFQIDAPPKKTKEQTEPYKQYDAQK